LSEEIASRGEGRDDQTLEQATTTCVVDGLDRLLQLLGWEPLENRRRTGSTAHRLLLLQGMMSHVKRIKEQSPFSLHGRKESAGRHSSVVKHHIGAGLFIL
jgi:hypothetical protein